MINNVHTASQEGFRLTAYVEKLQGFNKVILGKTLANYITVYWVKLDLKVNFRRLAERTKRHKA